jgi:hypothetical protein
MKGVLITRYAEEKKRWRFPDFEVLPNGTGRVAQIFNHLERYNVRRSEMVRPKPGIIRYPIHDMGIDGYYEICINVPKVKGYLP